MSTLTLKELENLQSHWYIYREARDTESVHEKELAVGFAEKMDLKMSVLLSLARRQLEQQEGCPEGVRPPASACAPPAGTDALRDVEKYLNQADQLVERCLHLLDNGAPQMARDAAYDASAAISDASRALIVILPVDHGTFELKPHPVQGDGNGGAA